jgi:hypothetical protein
VRANFPLRTLLRAFGVAQDQAALAPERSDFERLELAVDLVAPVDVWGGLRRRAFASGGAANAVAAEYGCLQLAVGGNGAWVRSLNSNTAAFGVVRVGVLAAPIALNGSVVQAAQAFDDGRDNPSQCVVTTGTLPAATVDAAGVVTPLASSGGTDPFDLDDAWFLPPGSAFLLTGSNVFLAVSLSLRWLEARASHEPLLR